MCTMPADLQEVARTACDVHRASQRADELAQALTLVAALAPHVIVEIGCDAGGTLYAWSQVCPRVYGITLADNSYAAGGSGQPLNTWGADVHIGDSHDPASLEWLVGKLDGQPVDVLVIDGDHSYDGVRADVAAFGPLVRAGGLMLLHDINVDEPRAQVSAYWPELAGGRNTSEIRSPSGISYGWGVVHVGAQPWT